METNTKIDKIIIFSKKDNKDYWIEEPLREEFYRSELELNHYLRLEKLEKEAKNDEIFDEFVYNYLKQNGETPGDLTLFVKELRTFLALRKNKSTKNNRIG